MLYEDEPTLFLNHLQIKRDFTNHNMFYYFPAAPRIHRDPVTGKPAFQLLKYARDITDNPSFPPETREQVGGGFLTMTVDIGVDDAVLEDTRNKLAAFTSGEVMLAPVPFHTGSVRLVALGAGNEADEGQPTPDNVFVESIFGATKPSLYADNLALFGVHLSQEGATLVEDSFQHGGDLIGVVYDLTYTAIRPAIQVKAEIDYTRVYDKFEASIGFQYAMIGVELDATLEWLREQGAITIEITEYDPAGTTESALRTQAMDLIKNEIIAKMFRPSLTVPSSAPRTSNPLEQVLRLSQDLTRPPANGGSGGGGSPTPAPAPVTEGERGPRSMEGRDAAATSGGSSGAAGGGASAGFALSFSLKYVHQEERRRATFDFRVNQAVNRVAAPQGSLALLADQLGDASLSDLIRTVNLDDEFFHELRANIGVTGDWSALGIEKVVVNATYQPDPNGPVRHTAGWTFNSPADAAQPFNVLIDRQRPTRQYRYRTQVFLKDSIEIDSRERVLVKDAETEQRQLVIQPANEFKPLVVSVDPSALDWSKAKQVDVLLRYEDQINAFSAQQRFVFGQGSSLRTWVLYPIDTALRSYTVQLSYQLSDGSSFTLDPVAHADEGFLVPGPFRGSRRVRLLPAFDSEDIQEVTAELLFDKAGYRFYCAETFSAGDLAPRQIEIPIPDPDPKNDSYEARWTVTKADFEVEEYDWSTQRSQQCVISDGVHGREHVKLVFSRSVAQAGLSSVLLTLRSLDADDQVIDSDSQMLRDTATEAATDLLTIAGSPLRYRYELKKFSGGGSSATESELQTDRTSFVEL